MGDLILAVNAGSGSIKAKLYSLPGLFFLAAFKVNKVRKGVTLLAAVGQEEPQEESLPGLTLLTAIKPLVAKVEEICRPFGSIAYVGHRVVQGGPFFAKPAVMDRETVRKINGLSTWAPLHNPLSLAVYREFAKALPAWVGHVAVFDTSLFVNLPDEEKYFPIPLKLSKAYDIRRYGAHGLAHEYLSSRCYEKYMKTTKGRLITMQIGSGASLSAFRDGVCIATSMGLTPLGGIMMSTRSGDLDPSVVTFLLEKTGMGPQDLESKLNRESGLLGISGVSGDWQEVKKAIDEGNQDAILAGKIFIERIADCIGSYFVKLGGLDSLVFGGGIFENAPYLRASLAKALQESLGTLIDSRANGTTLNGKEGIISAPGSKVQMVVIPTDEEYIIARDAAKTLKLR